MFNTPAAKGLAINERKAYIYINISTGSSLACSFGTNEDMWASIHDLTTNSMLFKVWSRVYASRRGI